MSWANDLQQASFRGVEFECISTRDSVKKSLAVHQAPYSNDAQIEDMGNDPRQINLRIILADDDTTDDYKLFLDALEIALNMTGPGELIHPIYGIKTVTAVDYEVQHDTDLVDGCYVDVNFLVAKSEKNSFLFLSVYLKKLIMPW